MVESLYGGKVFPHCHKRSLLHRRFSTGILSPPNPLHTISELNDDTSSERPCEPFSGNRTLLYVESTAAQHTAHRSNRPRAFSLPAIYRDGSYLRIKLPDGETFPGGLPASIRRSSEPAIVSQSAASRRNRSASFLSAESGSGTRSRSSSSSSAVALEVPFEETTPREYRSCAMSQSDPTAVNIIGQVRKQRLAEAEINGGGDLVNIKNVCTESWYSQNTSVAANESEIACPRSQFPLSRVLLNVVDHRARCDTSTRRRQSYPPSKPELDNRMQKLPEIGSLCEHKAFSTSNKSEFYSAHDCEKGYFMVGGSDKEQSSNIEILTRWMKFFG